MITLAELRIRIEDEWDPDYFVERLSIKTADLVNAFVDKIDDHYTELCEEFEEDPEDE